MLTNLKAVTRKKDKDPTFGAEAAPEVIAIEMMKMEQKHSGMQLEFQLFLQRILLLHLLLEPPIMQKKTDA